MKKLFMTLMAVSSLFFVTAQEDFKTIFNQDEVKFSGFGGSFNEISYLNGELISASGGGGGLLMNQKFFIGGYGLGYNSFYLTSSDNGQTLNTRYSMGHGGLWLGYVHNYRNVIHVGANMKLGAGGIDEIGGQSLDVISVAQPEFNVEVNVLSWFKITGGIGYRMVYDLDNVNNHDQYDFNGANFSLGFYFGLFNQRLGE